MSAAKSVAQAIERYLRSGKYEPDHSPWPGDFFERARRGHRELLEALVIEVRRRSAGRRHPPVPRNVDLTVWTRRKLSPMVEGLFPQAEREAVMALLERSVAFVTAASVEPLLLSQRCLHTAWDLANLYLTSVGADLLGEEASALLGLSEETTCYVSTLYFAERGRIEDFVIHEAAHVFHNCKRGTAGLVETRTREWLLLLEFGKRETFAYSCEAYGWIAEHASGRAERMALAGDFAKGAGRVNDETVDPGELADIVREACAARNGWKVILRRCAPARRPRARLLARISPLTSLAGA